MLYATLFFGCAAAKSLIKPTDKTYVQESLGEICKDLNETEIWDGDDLQEDFKFACKQAAEVFGYSFSPRTKHYETRPRGCFAKNSRVYFNDPKEDGKSHHAVRPICRTEGVYDEKCEDICKPWTASNMCGHIDDKTPSSCKAKATAAPANTGSRATSRAPSSSYRRPAAPSTSHRYQPATSSHRRRHSLSRSSQKTAQSGASTLQTVGWIAVCVVGLTIAGLAIGLPFYFKR